MAQRPLIADEEAGRAILFVRDNGHHQYRTIGSPLSAKAAGGTTEDVAPPILHNPKTNN